MRPKHIVMQRFRHQGLHRILPVSLALLLAVSCGAPEKSGSIPDEELRILFGCFAEEPVTKPLVANEALIGANEFFVSYKGEDGLVYSDGNWSNRSQSGGQTT